MLRFGKYSFDLTRPLVMGIVNLTSDSFSGDGLANAQEATKKAMDHAWHQIQSGADILDLGAESSRPGANPVSSELELARLLPVLEGLKDCGVPISVDTCKSDVMQAVLAHGASMINDIMAFGAAGAIDAVKASDCALCAMHMQGEPRTMQASPTYQNVVTEVRSFLEARARILQSAGVSQDRIVLDPGFGFGKTYAHNLQLLASFDALAIDGFPLLAGISRKATLGEITGRPPAERVTASVTAALLAIQKGARIVRVHDVAATVDAIKVLEAVKKSV